MNDCYPLFGRWLAACVVVLCFAPLVWAAPTPEQRAAEALVKKAERLCNTKKYEEAREVVDKAQLALDKIEDSPQSPNFTANLRKSLARVSQRVERAEAKRASSASGVSFSKQIAPFLVAQCGKCHIDKSRGKLSLASYAQLSKGSKTGPVIVPGKAKQSLLVQMIESGDMPRGDGKVSAEELALLTKWIDQGAIFDGLNPADPISASKSESNDSDTKLEVVRATGKEELQFARDIGPILSANCLECHGERNPRARLSLFTFAGLLNGGESGLALQPGKPDESLIIKKLRGMAGGDRMPKDRPPLPEETIAKIEKWIAGGALFDGPDANQPLVKLMALVTARAATHEELNRSRAELAAKNWHLMLPDTKPTHIGTKHFLLYGNVGGKTLDEIGRTAEQLVPKIEKALKLPSGQPFIKGKITIYVFDKRYDYTEVGTMLENREIPEESRGHWRFDYVDAYACIVPPKQNEYSLDSLLGQQIAAVCIAGVGEMPQWFAEGSGRVVATKLDAKDPRVRQWDQQIPAALASSKKPDDFLTGNLAPQDSELASYAFVKFLMSGAGRYQKLINAVRSGTPFNQAFAQVYGGTPNQVATHWIQQGHGR